MTHNTREWVTEFDEQFKGAIQLKNKPDGVTVTRLKHFIHQELQKAREEERERIANKIQVQIDYYSDYANDGGKVDERLATLLWCKHQSELDQPNK